MNFTNCIVKSCKNKAYPGTTVKFHPLPKDPALRTEWLRNLNRKIYQTVDWEACALVCGDHFRQEHYDEFKQLLKDAVPIKATHPPRRLTPWYYRVNETPSIKEEITDQISIEILPTDETASLAENDTPSAGSQSSIKEESTDQISIEILPTNETASITDNKLQTPSAGSQSSIKEESTDQISIEILPINETASITENDSPCDAPAITEDNIDLPNIETSSINEEDSPTEDNEAENELVESHFGVANEPDESDSVASENLEEIETVIEVEDDEDVTDSIRVIIEDWDGPGSPTVRVAAPDDVMHGDDDFEVPEIIKHTHDDFEVPEIIKACRVCLAMDGRMFRLQSPKQRQMYTDATGIPMTADDAFPQYLCWECAGRVSTAARFRAKAQAARHALMGLLYDHGKITTNSVRAINRREHKLTSQLSEKYMKPNDYIHLGEVRFKDISDIMSHKNDNDQVEGNTYTDMVGDIFSAKERPICLFDDEIDLIPDRTLIDVDIDMENYTDVQQTKNDVGNDIDVVDVTDVKENDAVGDENEKSGDEPTKGLWVGKLTRHPKWNSRMKLLDYLKYFTITTISKEEELAILMSKKSNAPFKCDLCHRGYLLRSVYEKHVLRHTEKYGAFECDICKLRKPTSKAILTHNLACHGKKYSCNECPYVTVDVPLAKHHYQQHSGEKFGCPQCPKKFSAKTTMYCHLRASHLGDVPCELCGDTFPTRIGKNKHLKLIHPVDKDKTPLEGPHCAVCDVTFASRAAHDTHLTKSLRHNDNVTPSRKVPEYFKDFTITKVTKEDEIAEMQTRKQTSAPYKCKVCYRGYLTAPCYEEHILKHTEKYGTFECEICKIRSQTEKQLHRHIRKLHRKRYSCKKCAFVTSSVEKAKYHHKHHAADVKYQCPHCSREFSRQTTYHGHLRMSHPCDFACEYCGHTFRSEKGKLFHQTMTHRFDKDKTPLEGPYCDVCDVTFASCDAHDTHLTKSSRHNDDKTSKIHNKYAASKIYRKYKRTRKHTPAACVSVTCELCDQTLPSIRMYGYHFKTYHPGQTRTQHCSSAQAATRFICEHCGKVYQSVAHLEDHMSVHTGEYFECHECGKRFRRKHLLAVHVNIHDEKRPIYKCTSCPKRFLTPSSRIKHIRASHMKVKPYECAACGIRFVVPSLLRAHIDHVHNKVPWPKRNRRPARTEH